MKKALIIRFSSLGDILLTLPVIKTLNENNFQVDYITFEQFSDLLNENPYINNLYLVNKKKMNVFNIYKVISQLRENEYDVVFDLHKNLKSFILTKFINSRVIRYKKFTFSRFLLKYTKINLLPKRDGITKEYMTLLKRVGVKKDFKPEDLYIYLSHERERVYMQNQEFLHNYVVINPNASKPTKCLPNKKIVKIAKSILDNSDKNLVFIGSGYDEFAKCEKIISKLGKRYLHRIKNYANKSTVIQLIIIIKNCDLLVTNDSGPMHIGSAYQKPTIGFFGPTTKEFGFFPENENITIFQREIKCRPCSLHGSKSCRLKHFKCMRLIDENKVIEKIKEILPEENNEM